MHSVKYNIEVYPSELSKQMTTKSLGGFMASQSLLVFVQSLMAKVFSFDSE